MSWSTEVLRANYQGNGTDGPFTLTNIRVTSAGDVLVVVRDTTDTTDAGTLLVLDDANGYSVDPLTIGGTGGPEITLKGTRAALSSDFKISIGTKLALTQPTGFRDLKDWPPVSVEEMADRQMRSVEQQQDDMNRALKFGFSIDANDLDPHPNPDLPVPVENGILQYFANAWRFITASAMGAFITPSVTVINTLNRWATTDGTEIKNTGISVNDNDDMSGIRDLIMSRNLIITGDILDSAALQLIKFVEVSSAINEVTVSNAAIGNNPSIAATGDDTNISLKVSAKGTGGIILDDIHDTNDNELIVFSATASAVNEITAKNAATGNAPSYKASGDDANIDLELAGKGTGGVKITSDLVPAGGAGSNSTQIGLLAVADGLESVVIGDGATDNAKTLAVVVGKGASASKNGATVLGNSASGGGLSSISIGQGASAVGDRTMAIGAGSSAPGGQQAISIGNNSTASGTDSLGIGQDVLIAHTDSIGIGRLATSTKTNQAVIGGVAHEINELLIKTASQLQFDTDGNGLNIVDDLNVTAPGVTPAAADKVLFEDISNGDVVSSNTFATAFDEIATIADSFLSSGQTITSAALLTLAHGLTRGGSIVVPKFIQFYIKCTSAEFGWAVDDEVVVDMVNNSNSSATIANGVSFDTTNILVRFSSAAKVFQSANKATGAPQDLTNANWDLFVRALA